MGATLREQLNGVITKFIGTHNYHNFTRRLHPNEGSAKRQILSMEFVRSFIDQDIEYLEFEIHGAAFLYHQIRKMIGFLAVMMRGYSYKLKTEQEALEEESSDNTDIQIINGMDTLLSMAFSAKYKMSIPLAPSYGLYLKEIRFDKFNRKVIRDGQSWKEIIFDRWNDGINGFIDEQIMPSIVRNENQFALWLYALDNEIMYEVQEMTAVLKRKRNEEGHQYINVGVPSNWRDGLIHENSRIAHAVQSNFLREILEV